MKVKDKKQLATVVAVAHDVYKKMPTFGQIWKMLNDTTGKMTKSITLVDNLTTMVDEGYLKRRKRKHYETYGVTDKAREKWKELK